MFELKQKAIKMCIVNSPPKAAWWLKLTVAALRAAIS